MHGLLEQWETWRSFAGEHRQVGVDGLDLELQASRILDPRQASKQVELDGFALRHVADRQKLCPFHRALLLTGSHQRTVQLLEASTLSIIRVPSRGLGFGVWGLGFGVW